MMFLGLSLRCHGVKVRLGKPHSELGHRVYEERLERPSGCDCRLAHGQWNFFEGSRGYDRLSDRPIDETPQYVEGAVCQFE